MKQIGILVIITLLFSCRLDKELKGVWSLTYHSNENDEIYVSQEKILFEFNSGVITMTTIGDAENGDLKKILTNKDGFYNEKYINIEGKSMNYSLEGDSIILFYDKLTNGHTKTVLRKLNPSLTNKKKCDLVNHSFSLHNKNTQKEVNIAFINDSLLLHTGGNIKDPLEEWGIIEYKGFSLLIIYNELLPLMVIESCSKERIMLEYPTFSNLGMTLKPIQVVSEKQKLLGNWSVVNKANDYRKYNLNEPKIKVGDKINITIDSILFENQENKALKWELTNDMKRVYFINKIFEEDGTWKIESIKNEILTILVNGNSEDRTIDTLRFLKK